MGKQTAVVMTDEDERAFMAFLRGIADVRFLADYAPTQEALWVDEFLPREQRHWMYFIWNRAFPWTPVYALTNDGKSHYVRNQSDAPLIEYSRHELRDLKPLFHEGRVYWGKYFAAPNGLHYDVTGFDRWYGQVVRWIRKNGRQKQKGTLNPYYLPDAWAKYGGAP